MLLPQAAAAQSRYVTDAHIDGPVAAQARGVVAVNQAAGDGNQQVNAAAIAISEQAAAATVRIGQPLQDLRASLPEQASARIGAEAFAHAAGLIAVNQASGYANAQCNSVAIAIGYGEVGDGALQATLPEAPERVAAGGTAVRAALVDETAFRQASGLVQLNQTAGAGNRSANNFALRINAGSPR